MMNITINRDDYPTEEAFLIELKKALRYKGNSLAKQAIGTMDTGNIYRTLLPDYLYYRLFDDIGEPLEGNYTYIIKVEQENGSGGYFFKDGLFRKQGKTVNFKIFPPLNMFIDSVTMNNHPIIKKTDNNEFKFQMPGEDANVKIMYNTDIETTIIYWGISLNNTPDSVNIPFGFKLTLNVNTPITVNFDNIGNMGYIWFATKLDLTKQQVGLAGFSKFNITGTFNKNTTNSTIPDDYFYYFHKWPTEVEKITFS